MLTQSTLPTNDATALLHALSTRLQQLGALAAALTPVQYTSAQGPGFFGATIGAHIRHCLDHVRALVEGARTGHIEYDHRERGTPIESSPSLAAAHTSTLIAQLAQLDTMPARHPLELVLLATHDEPAATVASTFARELAFVLSHTIHHQAIIHAMLSGGALTTHEAIPSSFGLAPSTIAHQHAASCAR